MATITKGKTFINGELVTPEKIHQLVDAATVTGIATADISDSAVTAAKIANANVTTVKIADANVTTAKIADSAVTSAKIADGTIVNADIAATAAIADTKLATISTAGKVSNSATTATSANTANTIVLRNSNRSISLNVIDATSPGNSSGILNVLKTDSTRIGGILSNSTNTGVVYATSSDYRLKADIERLTGAVDRLSTLPVHRFKWIGHPASPKVDGFLAHEAQTIVPESVTGTKDAVDSNGNPIFQGIDQSKLVPLLVAAVQELAARVAALEAK